MSLQKQITLGVIAIVGVLSLILSIYTIKEGHVGIVKRFSRAIAQVDPGIHLKIPFVDTVTVIEVRQRKNVEELAAATANQLRITATTSINWTVNKESALQLFIDYGGLDQFETRILDPKLRSSAKAALSKFPADELIRNRQAAVAEIMNLMLESLEGFPITVNSPQIENIQFPKIYMDAVLAKEQSREDAEKEKHKLEQQRLQALQSVNTAEADAEARRLSADARAYQIRAEAEARAEAIRIVGEQLRATPMYVEYRKVLEWNGTLPTTLMMGDESGQVLLRLP